MTELMFTNNYIIRRLTNTMVNPQQMRNFSFTVINWGIRIALINISINLMICICKKI